MSNDRTRPGDDNTFLQRYPHLSPNDDLLKIMAWAEQLEQKVDAFSRQLADWTAAIVAQTQLSTDQSKVISSLNSQPGIPLQQLTAEIAALKGEFVALKQSITDRGLSSSKSPIAQQIERWKQQGEWDALFDPDAVTLKTLSQKLDRIESSLDNLWSYVSSPQTPNIASRIGNAITGGIGSAMCGLVEGMSQPATSDEERSFRRFLVGVCLVLLLVLSLVQFVSGFQVETKLARLREQSDQLQEQTTQLQKQLEKGNALQNSILSYVRDAAGR